MRAIRFIADTAVAEKVKIVGDSFQTSIKRMWCQQLQGCLYTLGSEYTDLQGLTGVRSKKKIK